MIKKEFESEYIMQLTFDKPIDVNNLLLYPVPMEQYFEFNIASSVLQIKKDRIPNARIISMSYMDFLIEVMREESKPENPEGEHITQLFMGLMSLCLRKENPEIYIVKDKDGKRFLRIEGRDFRSRQFNELKDVILFQNLPNYTGIELNEDLEKEIEEADKIRNYGKHPASLEETIISAMVGTSMSLDDIKKMSIRKFFKLVNMKDREITYKISEQASLSGFVKFKKEPLHYLQNSEEDWLDSKVHTYDSLKKKLSGFAKS